MHELIPLVPAIPLLSFLIISLTGKFIKKELIIGTIGSGSVGISFMISILIFISLLQNSSRSPYVINIYEWISAGKFSINISYQVDQLSIIFSLIVTGVGFLIHVYSIGYMHGDRGFYRFFSYLNLFIFMMLNLVLSSNFLLTFLGWEGVGLCSYLLIGFWYERKFDGYRIVWTGDAGNKAFIVNRIGDFGFIIAMFLIYLNFHSLDYEKVFSMAFSKSDIYAGSTLITAITILLFLGCTGKSAQLPLAVWLPDAMAGPTPVSALIHAATMVTAGIFLVARNSVLFSLSPITMEIVAVVGVATAFLAATVGLVQNDFKKVLAYSTVSQLGFMFIALGVGAFTAGIFHVMTHAFFKGLLFLAAGAVIHGMHDVQNIKLMGGLKKYMPTTYKTFFIATLAIAGIPFFSGFFSKDEILWMAFSRGSWILWLLGALAAFCTAFYMFRLLKLVFEGNERFDQHHVHPHEAPKVMLIPLILLAILSALGGFLGIPYSLGGWFNHSPNLIESWLHPVFANAQTILKQNQHHTIHIEEYILMVLSIIIALSGIILAAKWYKGDWVIPKKLTQRFRLAYSTLWNKYYLDNVYFLTIVDPILNLSRSFLWKVFDNNIIDGIVNNLAKLTSRSGEFLRRMQSGIAQNYALLMMIGIIIILSILILNS